MMSFSLYSPQLNSGIDDVPEPANLEVPLDIGFPDLKEENSFDIDLSLRSPLLDQNPADDTSFDMIDLNPSPIKFIPAPINQQKNVDLSKKTAPFNPYNKKGFSSALSFLMSSARYGHPQQQKTKEIKQITPTASDSEFAAALTDKTLTFNPVKLGFIPQSRWNDKIMTFGDVVADFFQRKNNANCRFSFKLYNALKLTMLSSKYNSLIGVRWITDDVLRVDKLIFARLLGIKSIDGSLFHQQGNFPSHGFVEMNTQAVDALKPNPDVDDVDFENVRLLRHVDKLFVKGCTEKDLENCKWVNSRPKRC